MPSTSSSPPIMLQPLSEDLSVRENRFITLLFWLDPNRSDLAYE
jgi:hypothetical protein